MGAGMKSKVVEALQLRQRISELETSISSGKAAPEKLGNELHSEKARLGQVDRELVCSALRILESGPKPSPGLRFWRGLVVATPYAACSMLPH